MAPAWMAVRLEIVGCNNVWELIRKRPEQVIYIFQNEATYILHAIVLRRMGKKFVVDLVKDPEAKRALIRFAAPNTSSKLPQSLIYARNLLALKLVDIP